MPDMKGVQGLLPTHIPGCLWKHFVVIINAADDDTPRQLYCRKDEGHIWRKKKTGNLKDRVLLQLGFVFVSYSGDCKGFKVEHSETRSFLIKWLLVEREVQ